MSPDGALGRPPGQGGRSGRGLVGWGTVNTQSPGPLRLGLLPQSRGLGGGAEGPGGGMGRWPRSPRMWGSHRPSSPGLLAPFRPAAECSCWGLGGQSWGREHPAVGWLVRGVPRQQAPGRGSHVTWPWRSALPRGSLEACPSALSRAGRWSFPSSPVIPASPRLPVPRCS